MLVVAARGTGSGPGGSYLPELVPIWSEYVTEVVPFGVHAVGVSSSLCRVWSRRMRVLRCACLPPFAACLRLVLSACGRVAFACSGPALSSCPARPPEGLSFAVRGLDRVGALPPQNIG